MVFSDKKKDNLDGPDGFQCYWHGLRKEKLLSSMGPFGRGSVIVWVAFTASEKANLLVREGKQNCVRYITGLEKFFFPISDSSKHQ